ncbi:MAG: leucine-rich repeat domain-containing protein [Clostridia bacterium]|nr:leucine-rich repeat domain-containing protein [Clostridia bacterium]
MDTRPTGLIFQTMEGGFCKISDFNGADQTLVIPREKDGCTVKEIGIGAFLRKGCLKTVVLPDTVEKIDDMAFYECRALEEIVLPDGVTEIGYEAFGLCESLRICLGKNVREVKSCALRGVRSIAVAEGNPYFCADGGNLYSKDGKTLLQYTPKEDETVFSVPEGVETLGNGAFIGCERLSEIRLPESLRTIGWSVFEGCKGLRRMTLPDGLVHLGGGAFTDCDSLTEISVGIGLKTIGESVFQGCYSLQRLRYGGNAAAWRAISFTEDWADDAPCLRIETSESVPQSADGTPSALLDYAVNTEGKSCTVIGIGLCTDTRLVFPSEIDGFAVTAIGKSEPPDNGFSENYVYFEGSFAGRRDIESVFIPEGVTAVGDCAFRNCSSLKSVWISGSVRYIGASAFEGCRSLESVFLEDGVETVGWNAFFGCISLAEIRIPDSVTKIHTGAFAGGIAAITASPEHPLYQTADGNLYSRDGKTLLQYAAGKRDTAFRCPKAVTAIGQGAFRDATALTDAVLGENVKTIGDEAFRGCKSLSFIHIPDGVAEIGNEAFSGCASLFRPRFGKGVREIGAYAFAHCAALRTAPLSEGVSCIRRGAFFGCASLRKAYVPDSVTEIADHAFAECASLREISLPAGLTWIGEEAFLRCGSLRTVVFRGTVAQWSALSAGRISAVRSVVCTDGTVSKNIAEQPYDKLGTGGSQADLSR